MQNQSSRPVTTYEAVLGQVLRKAREDRGLGQGDLARLVGVTQPYWSKIEQGHANASVGVLRRASEQLGTPYSEIASRADQACDEATKRGVRVLSREETQGGDWLPILGIAAIGALIGFVLAKRGK